MRERLLQRVTHLRAVLAWADDLSPPATAAHAAVAHAAVDKLQAALALAHKVLADRADPKAGDKVVSAHDPERGGASTATITTVTCSMWPWTPIAKSSRP